MTAGPWPILRHGSTGDDVTALQYLLRSAREAWRTLAADGVFGERTESIVRAFQDFTGVTVDGVVGASTWGKLTDGTIGSTVRADSQGDAVRAAQTELLKQGFLKSIDQVDGDFGPATDDAVREFQEEAGLPADGIVGVRTWRELVSG